MLILRDTVCLSPSVSFDNSKHPVELSKHALCVPTSPLCNCACNLPRNTTCIHRHYSHFRNKKKNSTGKKKKKK
ncbi:hypothetical protein PUN28_013458 [Cardiocondyla obscurior]|uniref:Uncharacterized protein n=1 Tax=Cardiocondyla obscurior TaxID=286306 RepID=A0AAW2F1C7_9HYME